MNNFRRITLAGMLAGIGALFAGRALAHGRHGGHFGSGDRIDKMVKHLAVEVDATPEQQEKLTAIAKQAARDLEPLRGQAMDTRRQAMELLASPSVDRAALEQLRVAKLQHAEAASKRITQALADAAEVLAPEQRRKLAEYVGRMGHHRRRWG